MRFHVDLVGTANVTVITDAAGPEEAAEIAADHIPNLCHQCAGGRQGRPSLDLDPDFEVVAITDDDGKRVLESDSEAARIAGENRELRARLAAVEALIAEQRLVSTSELRAALTA